LSDSSTIARRHFGGGLPLTGDMSMTFYTLAIAVLVALAVTVPQLALPLAVTLVFAARR